MQCPETIKTQVDTARTGTGGASDHGAQMVKAGVSMIVSRPRAPEVPRIGGVFVVDLELLQLMRSSVCVCVCWLLEVLNSGCDRGCGGG